MLENNQKDLILLEDLGYLFPTINSKQKKKFGIYKCYCGNEFKAQIQSISNMNTKSCGCHKIQRIKKMSITHGLGSHRLYSIWCNMIYRCKTKKGEHYKDYGARGIIVCDRWHDIKNFIEDMYPTFEEGLTIDRKDNDLGYYKDNCRWVNQNIQSRNTRILYSHNTSGYRGVSFYKNKNLYSSRIVINKKTKSLGYFKIAIDAARAYDQYVIDNNLEHTINGVLT